MGARAFAFSAENHEYFLHGQRVPSVTDLIEQAGLIDTTWMTDASRQRGTAIHDLASAFDMGALTVESCVSPYRGWLLGHVAATQMLNPAWDEIEVPCVHPKLKLAGRPDRVGRCFGLYTILEIKSGAREPSHAIQVALQCFLKTASHPLPAERWQRLILYLRDNGKFVVEQCKDPRDFTVARDIIKRFC